MIDALRMIQTAAIIGDCLLAGILIVILSALIVMALLRKRPRIHDAPRPRTLPTPPRYPVPSRYVAAPDSTEPPTHKRKNRKRNKPPSGRKARKG